MVVFDILMRWHCPNCGKHTAAVIEVPNEDFDVLGDESITCQWCQSDIRVHWHTQLKVSVSNQHMRLKPVAVDTDIWRAIVPDEEDPDDIPEFESDEEAHLN